MPMRCPEPGGAQVYVIGPSVLARPRKAASEMLPPTSSLKVSSGCMNQPRSTPPTVPLAMTSHSGTSPPTMSEL